MIVFRYGLSEAGLLLRGHCVILFGTVWAQIHPIINCSSKLTKFQFSLHEVLALLPIINCWCCHLYNQMMRSEISLNTSELRSEKVLLFAASAPHTVSSSVGKQISSRHPAVQLNCLIGHREVNNHTSANVHKYRANLQSHSRPLIFTSPQIVTSGNIIKNEYAPTHFLGKGNNCKSMFKTEITQCVVRLYYITCRGFLLSRISE